MQEFELNRCPVRLEVPKHSGSVQDGRYALRKACMRFTLSLGSCPCVASETIPVLVRSSIALSRPFKGDCWPLPLSTLLLTNWSDCLLPFLVLSKNIVGLFLFLRFS